MKITDLFLYLTEKTNYNKIYFTYDTKLKNILCALLYILDDEYNINFNVIENEVFVNDKYYDNIIKKYNIENIKDICNKYNCNIILDDKIYNNDKYINLKKKTVIMRENKNVIELLGSNIKKDNFFNIYNNETLKIYMKKNKIEEIYVIPKEESNNTLKEKLKVIKYIVNKIYNECEMFKKK